MTSPPLTHAPRIIRRQRGPLGHLYWTTCECGYKSPETIYRDVATQARERHLWELGRDA